jgi:hypothetical protein
MRVLVFLSAKKTASMAEDGMLTAFCELLIMGLLCCKLIRSVTEVHLYQITAGFVRCRDVGRVGF